MSNTEMSKLDEMELRLDAILPPHNEDGTFGDGSHEHYAYLFERAYDRAYAIAREAIAHARKQQEGDHLRGGTEMILSREGSRERFEEVITVLTGCEPECQWVGDDYTSPLLSIAWNVWQACEASRLQEGHSVDPNKMVPQQPAQLVEHFGKQQDLVTKQISLPDGDKQPAPLDEEAEG